MTSSCSALVIFGITGDLARKKLFSALYELEVLGELGTPVVGVGRSPWSTEKLREIAGKSIDAQGEAVCLEAKERVLNCLEYVEGSYDSPALFEQLAIKLETREHVLCYLAVPPEAFSTVVEGLGNSPIRSKVRLLLEKPFGHNRESAIALNALVLKHFKPDQLFAVDHYLQKESLQNLLVLRFANRIFESLWNRASIHSVEITMAEASDLEGRGAFYDAAGTLRDVIQNHGLQILTALAMEPPKSSSTEDLDAARFRLLQEVQTLALSDVIFGQYNGYHDVEGVARGSTTETFVRARFSVDDERWQGVEWTIVAGKALDRSTTQVVLRFKPATDPSFIGDTCAPDSNQITLTLGPVEAIEFDIQARSNALSMGTALTALASATNYRPDQHLDAYGRVFENARRNDQSGFASPAVVDQSWRIINAVLGSKAKPLPYEKGSTGPKINV